MDNLYIMETEKYYGLNEPDKTTTIDSSNIDYNIPGQTTENPSLNTTNTSILYKASATSNYVKRDNCPVTFTIEKHNDAITDSSLYVIKYQTWAEDGLKTFYTYYLNANGEKKQIYLGYEDTNKIFTNKLGTIITTQVTTLESDTGGCSAKAYLIQNDNTGAPIKYSLNTCTQDRLITFSYKNTPIFSIKQTYDNSGSLTPSILYESENTYKKYPNTEPLHLYYYKNIEDYDSYLTIPDSYITGYRYAWFGLLDSNGKADNNLEYTSTDQLSKYNQKFGCSISGLTIEIMETNLYIKNTALMIVINTTQTTEVNRDFKITYDGKFLCNVKKIEKDT